MTDRRCQAETILGNCPDLALVAVQGGCRHEHIKVRDLCIWHATDLLSPDSVGVCGECAVLGHDCKVLARVVSQGADVEAAAIVDLLRPEVDCPTCGKNFPHPSHPVAPWETDQ